MATVQIILTVWITTLYMSVRSIIWHILPTNIWLFENPICGLADPSNSLPEPKTPPVAVTPFSMH
jgi:hypothetical protein